MKSNLGFLVVHLQEEKRSVLSHPSGSSTVGLSCVSNVLTSARELNLPIYLSKLDLKGNTDILPEVLESTGKSARVFDAPTYDPYFQTRLEEAIRKDNVGRLVIAGFHHSLCVYLTFLESLKRGLEVVTSMDLLFGDKQNDYIPFGSGQTHKAFLTYITRGTFYKNHRALIGKEFRKNTP